MPLTILKDDEFNELTKGIRMFFDNMKDATYNNDKLDLLSTVCFLNYPLTKLGRQTTYITKMFTMYWSMFTKWRVKFLENTQKELSPSAHSRLNRIVNKIMLIYGGFLYMKITKNSAHAQHSMGYMYLHGLGVKQDDQRAESWFKKAAETNAASAFMLACLYQRQDEGCGTKASVRRQMQYLIRAEKLGSVEASKCLKKIRYDQNYHNSTLTENQPAHTQQEPPPQFNI